MTSFVPYESAASGACRTKAATKNVKSRAWRFDMKALSKTFVLLLAAFGLASCGGGGGGSQGAFTPTPVDTIDIAPAATTISTNSFTTLVVTVKKQDGSVENDGTTVNASVTPSTIGTVAGKTGTAAGSTASNTLSGGKTTFNFSSSNQAGAATITISLPAGTNGTTTTATNSVTINVNAGNTQDSRLQLTATATTLPLNPYSIGDSQTAPYPGNFLGSPYISEVTVTWRHANGQLVSGTSCVNVSVAPTQVIQYSQLIGSGGSGCTIPTPTTGDLFHNLMGSGPVAVTGGVGTIYIHSSQVPGTGTLSVTATDPDNAQTLSSQLVFTVAGSGTTLPASISVQSSGASYVSNSGGQGSIITATVRDGSNAKVADPSGFNNVLFEVVGPANSDVRLSATNAAGQAVSGSSVSTITHSGVASVTVLPGSQQGPVQIRATADRGDNNVDNTIQDAVSATATVVVSDGKLFSLSITSPDTNAILVNRVSTDTGTGGGAIPPDPNATYSLTVSALATDRQGNAVLPGTQVRFGAIDAPQSNGFFSISGVSGNPQEGGTLFTANDGHFRTAGGGAGPGDTVIVFGKAVVGNDDLESAAKVAAINGDTSLNTVTPFNRNDTTGSSVDYGAVLPYIVGRAQSGNITSPASTNSFGVATTKLNYPISALGRAVAVWAQGTGTDAVTGGADVVTDADVLLFPGVAPASIVISPNPIPGDITIPVTACIFDALQSPIAGVHFDFRFDNLGIGSGKLDNISTAGTVPDATDASGCVTTSVVTTGIGTSSGSSGGPQLTFSLGSATASAPFVVSGDLILLAVPSILGGAGGDVTLQLLNSNGTPVPGIVITGSCSGDPSIGLKIPPGVTDANGKTTTTITANLDGVGGGKSGQCVFTTPTGSPTATVKLQGVDACLTSPAPPSCPPPTSTPQYALAVTLLVNNGTGSGTPYFGSVTSTPAGLAPPSCAMTNATTPATCSALFDKDTQVTLSPTLQGGATGVQWGGSCGTGTSLTVTVGMGGAKACTLTFTGP
jgi:hypothetical protein